MEENPKLAKKQITALGAQGTDIYAQMWVKLAVALNHLGAVQKTVSQWQTVSLIISANNKFYKLFYLLYTFLQKWEDMRSAARKTMSTYLTNAARTGNPPNLLEIDSDTERICSIYGEAATGLCIIHEIGLKNPKEAKSVYFDVYFICIQQ